MAEKRSQESLRELSSWTKEQQITVAAHKKVYEGLVNKMTHEIAQKKELVAKYRQVVDGAERDRLINTREVEEALAGIEELKKTQISLPKETKKAERELQELQKKLERSAAGQCSSVHSLSMSVCQGKFGIPTLNEISFLRSM